ncbi:HlyD family secretion protein [Agrobacterium sp. BA1120]|uniref:HlyD family secretion protein n=1 Tax=Agrobacterium sp. BA1120 TaxID=3228927 RepID=UPI00336A6D4F
MVELPRPEEFAVAGTEEGLRIGGPSELAAPVPSTSGKHPLQGAKRKRFRSLMLASAVIAACVSGGQTGYRHLVVDRYVETTDNAYLKADSTAVAPKVSGYIREILVNDNDPVKEGQSLARIDDRDFQIALSQARADLEAADAAIRNIDTQVNLQRSLVRQAEATLKASEAALVFAETDAKRWSKLITNGAGSQSRAEQTVSVRDQAKAAVKRDEANVVATRDRIPVLETQKSQAAAQRHKVEAQVAQAELNLAYTRIVSPVDGTVGARTLRIGQLVNAGTQLMSVVPLHSIYVVANFKETQLTDIKVGQPVEISVDSFPGIEFDGRVESLSPGSGSEFSLLPTDNATGNFTKIVQRVPVKIAVDAGDLSGSLRSGMSVVPRIDTAAGRSTFGGLWPIRGK